MKIKRLPPEAAAKVAPKEPENTYYTVTRVIDGDTIQVDIDSRGQVVRLIGVNTPETVHPTKPQEYFGKEASNYANQQLIGKKVRLETDPSQGDFDKYNRLLAYVFTEDGTNFNKKLIEEGYGYEYTYDTQYKYQEEFRSAESTAKKQEKGLWADESSIKKKTVREWLHAKYTLFEARLKGYEQTKFDPTEFEEARWKNPAPSMDEKYARWVSAGKPENFRIKTIASDPRMLIALTEEEYEATKGFTPPPDTLTHILHGTEGTRESRYIEAAEEYKEFKAGRVRRAQPSQQRRMGSWRRAGSPDKYVQKTYYDELGYLRGVATFTPEEIEELGSFKPSEAQIKQAFRSPWKTLPKEQFMVWAEEYKAEQEHEQQLREELRDLRSDLRGTTQMQRDSQVSGLLMVTRGGEDITERRLRRQELEDMLGEGVDR